MKKVVTILIVTLLTMASISIANVQYNGSQKKLTVVTGGSPGGTAFKRSQMYKDGLEALGYNVEIKSMNASESLKYFKETKDPVMMVYSTVVPASLGYNHTKNNFVQLEYYQPWYFCELNSAKDSNKRIVGVSKQVNPAVPIKVYKQLGYDVKVTKWKNSGAVYRAILAGDINSMYTNQGKSIRLMKSGKGTCIGNTSNQTVLDVPSMNSKLKNKIEFPIYMATVIANNTDIESLRIDLLKIRAMEPFSKWLSKSQYKTFTDKTRDQELEMSQESEILWGK